MIDIKTFVEKEKGFGSLVLSSTLPSLITPEQFWIGVLFIVGEEVIRGAIRYGKRIKRYKTELIPLMEELFLEGLSKDRREVAVGLRYESEPSGWDKLGALRSFSVPFVLERPTRRKTMKQPRGPSSEMSPIFIGGWRPIREVELILRKMPFIFGILRNDGKVYVPSRDELEEDVRRKPDKVVRWVVAEAEGEKVKKWWTPKYRQDGRPRSDLVIITRSTNPLNPEMGALAISGTHREGTLGGALLSSKPELLKDFYRLPELSKYLSTQYQVALRLHFNEFNPDKPKTLRVRKIELLGGSKL